VSRLVCGLKDQGSIRGRIKNFVFVTTSRPTLGPPSLPCNGYQRLCCSKLITHRWRLLTSLPVP